jgi:hypothetical protein
MLYSLALILQQEPNPAAVQQMVQHIVMTFIAILPILILIGIAIVVVPFWFICKKAGFSPWLSLLNIVPLGNLALIYVLAFADWKVVPAPPTFWQPQAPYPPQPPLVPQQPLPPQS